MPILFQSKNFTVEPFADRGGVFLVIIRKKPGLFGKRKVVAKIPFENKRQSTQAVKRRLVELENANRLTQEEIRRAQQAIKTGVRFGKEAMREFNQLTGNKPKRKKRKTKRKKKKRKR